MPHRGVDLLGHGANPANHRLTRLGSHELVESQRILEAVGKLVSNRLAHSGFQTAIQTTWLLAVSHGNQMCP